MIADALQAELGEVLPGAVCFDVPGRRPTSLRIGGPADALAAPPDRAALARLLRFCARRGLRRRAMGRGFNTILRHEGVDGVLLALSKLRRIAERPGGLLRVEAGVSHASLSHFCRERGLAGLEFGAGIPGSIGGWIAMNAGIPGREVKDVVRELEVMSPGGRRLRRIGAERLRFRYRGLAGLARARWWYRRCWPCAPPASRRFAPKPPACWRSARRRSRWISPPAAPSSRTRSAAAPGGSSRPPDSRARGAAARAFRSATPTSSSTRAAQAPPMCWR